MGLLRNLSGLTTLSLGVFYLTSASSLSNDGAWMIIGAIFLSTCVWVFSGGNKRKQISRIASKSAKQEVVEETEATSEPESNDDIPAPVKQENLDGVSLRERKLAKIQAAASQSDDETVEQPTVEVETIEVSIEDVHKADEYVVEVSPESIEDADIELTVSNRRIKHDEIRSRIERRRRGQLAEIRASTVRMWEQHTEGEDIVALLQTEGHGQNIIEQSLNSNQSSILGATFIRIDENTIFKLRTPLDSGFEEVEKKAKLPELPGMPLPPLPDGALPMPLPPPSASDALAQLKQQIDQD